MTVLDLSRPAPPLLTGGTRRDGIALLITGLGGLVTGLTMGDSASTILCGLISVAGTALYWAGCQPIRQASNRPPEFPRPKRILKTVAAVVPAPVIEIVPVAMPQRRTGQRRPVGRMRHAGLLAPVGS